MPPSLPHTDHAPGTGALYEEHGGRLYRYLLGMLGRPEDAEDVLQTVWSKLVGRLDRVRDPVAYLWRAARNEALRWRSGRRRRKRHEVADEELALFPDSVNPEASRDERLAITVALRGLPFEQREAVVLLAFEGLTAREAAVRLRTSENTVASRYRLAVAKLKRKLNRS